jgi:peptidoglycan/xylan/chitin deacetylase (PgdA/CDA1 family)
MDEATLRAVLERECAERKPVSLLRYLEAAPGNEAFTVSFDDAHISVFERAAPLLWAMNIPATLFVPTGWIGMGERWMSADQLRALRDQGWTIGAHTVTHPRMRQRLFGEDDAAYQARLYEECARSKETLERILGKEIALFAYPYGEEPKEAQEAVMRAGFRAAFSVKDPAPIHQPLAWNGALASIPRMDAFEATGLVVTSQEEPIGISVVVPVRDRRAMVREVLKRWNAQSYEEEKFEILVVDDGSKEPLDALVADLPHVRVLRASEPGAPFRAGQARNLGVAHARFPIIQLADSDIAVDSDFLWAVDWVHRRVPAAVLLGAISGYNLDAIGQLHRLEEIAHVDDLTRVPLIFDRQREPTLRAVIDNADWLEAPWKLFYTGNVSMPKSLFDAVGGFSNAFEGWGLEDLDLGLLLHEAGATYVASRFAVGLHLEDEDEAKPRNPFRRMHPTKEDFAPYLANLETWATLRAGSAAIAQFRERTYSDIGEITGRPSSVGVEMGGLDAEPRSPLHALLHRLLPAGATQAELLERVAYAVKVGARRLWLQGGDVGSHAELDVLLAAAKAAGLKTAMQSGPLGLVDRARCEALRQRGVDHVTLLLDPAHEALLPTLRDALRAAYVALRDASIDVGLRVVAATLEDARLGIANAFQIVGTEQAHRVQLLLPEALLVAGRAALPDIQCDELAP